MDAGRGGVHRELADGDLDAADALVADAEDAFGVGRHEEVDVLGPQAGVPQCGLHLVRVAPRQVTPAGATELVAEPLDRQPDRRGVDDRQHLLDVLGEQLVEQHLVAVAQVGQVHPLAQVVGLLAVLGVGPSQLGVQRRDPRREQAGQSQFTAFREGERGAAVDGGGGEHGRAAGVDPGDVAVRGLDQFVGSLGHLRAPRHFFFLGMYRSVMVPSNASAAMATVSERVGWGWMVSPTSAASAPISMASAASAMRSPALGPTIPAPMTRSLASSNNTLVRPSSRPRDSDRPEPAQGNTPLPYLTPAALASFSVTPTQATSGSV